MSRAVVFVVATDFERRAAEKGIRAFPGRRASVKARVANCGIGFRDPQPLEGLAAGDQVVSTGFAAGLDPGLDCGTVLVPAALVDSGGRVRPIASPSRRRLSRALASDRNVCTAPLAEAREILPSPEAKAAAAARSAGAGADMESLKLAEYCERRSFDFLVLRVVLDPSDAHLPHSIVAGTRNGTVPGPLTLAAATLLRPSSWRHLVSLLRFVRVAGPALELAVRDSLPSLCRPSGG